MNELLFLTSILINICFLAIALKISKEALICLICFYALIANLFVVKQITLFGFHVTASDAFSISSILGLNLLQEHFSKKDAEKTIYASFLILLLFVILSKVHLLFIPNVFDVTHKAFKTIFSHSTRIIFSSILVFFRRTEIGCLSLFFFKKKI